VGFTTTYHPEGTLRDILPFRRIHGTLRVADQIKWAIQLTSTLIHIRDHGRYYSDLRLDNILLSENDDLVLVDFEQRGVWCGFASPELNYLDYVFMLATDSSGPEATREKYEKLLQRHIPGYKVLLESEYRNPEHGFSIPWSGLNRSELEAAEVFMLGRVLWCIFEGQSCPEVAVWQSYQHDSDLEFPEYQIAPPEIRDLIRLCTAVGERTEGQGHNGGGVVRRGDRMVLKEGDGAEGPEIVQAEATRWWKRELQQAESFLEMRLETRLNYDGKNLRQRFSLSEALKFLENFQGSMNDSGTRQPECLK
jgi:serine/threonine protein kinase